MYDMIAYETVRMAVTHDGLSHREAARRFGIDPRTVRKMMGFSEPPGYRRRKPLHRPALASVAVIIDQILSDDATAPVKQRHSAQRIFERLRDEHGYKGSYTPVKVYVRGERLTHKEMFVPLVHPPGHAQVDPRLREGKLWRGCCDHRRRAAEDSFFLHGTAAL